MDLVQNFSKQITNETKSEDRYVLSCSFLIEIKQLLEIGMNFDADIVLAIVRSLLSVSLDSVHTTRELRTWLTNQEVKDVIWRFNTGPENASAILQGMSESVRSEGVGFDSLISWASELVHTWFVTKDNTVKPTSPGFVIELFSFIHLCADRQAAISGERSTATLLLDRQLLPLVSAALSTETCDTINKADRDGQTALHSAASYMRILQVTKALLKHPDIDLNIKNSDGMTALTRTIPMLVMGDAEAVLTIEALLSDSRLDLSVTDFMGNTALKDCFVMFENDNSNARNVLKFIQLAVRHSSVTPDMIQTIVTNLMTPELFAAAQNMQEKVVIEAASHQSFDINQELNDIGQTLGHLAALSGKGHFLLKVMEMEHFDPNSQDAFGNTIIYYACANLLPTSAKKVISLPSVTWDYTHTNNDEQTVLDYYEQQRDINRDPVVLGMLENRVGRLISVYKEPQGVPKSQVHRTPSQTTGPLEFSRIQSSLPTSKQQEKQAFLENPSTLLYGRQAADPQLGKTVNLKAREIHWNSPVSRADMTRRVKVQPSTQGFTNTKLDGISQNKIFPLTSAKKGKACIICVSDFQVSSLRSLNPGYTNDGKMLAELWSQMGYDVLVPSCHGEAQLTAEEMKTALREFARQLTEEDPSAVVCLLSHGHHGCIYGSDGKTVTLIDLLKNLDDEKCPQMKKKPKLSIVQACSGSSADYGVPAAPSSGPVAYSAANEPQLPTMSDIVICTAALEGYESYVRDLGSVFITRLVDIFARHSNEDDIMTLMTWVNNAVSDEDIAVQTRPGRLCKQISRVESCLTKLLYFFPCSKGKEGKNWAMLTDE